MNKAPQHGAGFRNRNGRDDAAQLRAYLHFRQWELNFMAASGRFPRTSAGPGGGALARFRDELATMQGIEDDGDGHLRQ